MKPAAGGAHPTSREDVMAEFRVPGLLIFFAALSGAQMQPQSAHVNLYFPHLADGGPASQKWQTTFTFVNTGLTDASVELALFKDDGSALQLDFGNGATSDLRFDVKAGGTRILRSLSGSNSIVTGWAAAMSDVPVMGTVAYRYFDGGAPRQEMAAQPALPTIAYYSAANSQLGVAIANVNFWPVNVMIDLLDSDGNYWGDRAIVMVPALGHTAFTLASLAPQFHASLDGFSGSVALNALEPPYDEFIAWTVGNDAQGIFTTLPPGPAAFPISHWDRIWLVHQQMLEAAYALGILDATPELDIATDPVVNAYAHTGNAVGVTLGLSQLIGDAPGELAFVMAHELAHIYQQRSGRLEMAPGNAETDADIWASVIMLQGGYDPYSISGALAKIQLAIAAGMTNGFEDLDNPKALQAVQARLNAAFNTLQTACNWRSDITQRCDYYKAAIHPNLPADWRIAPLKARPRPMRR
jgi:Zn-dependent protease with chaperone function